MELYEEKQLWAAVTLPKSQGHLLCFPRTTWWDSCPTETRTDVWQPPGKYSDGQLFTHMSKTSGPPCNCQLGPFNTQKHKSFRRDQQTDSCCRFIVATLHVAWELVTECTDVIINPRLVLHAPLPLSASYKNHLQTVPSPESDTSQKCKVTASTRNALQSLPLRQTNPSV